MVRCVWDKKYGYRWGKSYTKKKARTLLIIGINVLYNEGKSDIVLNQWRCIGQLTAMRLDYVPDIHCKNSFFGKMLYKKLHFPQGINSRISHFLKKTYSIAPLYWTFLISFSSVRWRVVRDRGISSLDWWGWMNEGMRTYHACCHPWEPIRTAAIHGNQSDLLPSMGTDQICCHPWEPIRSAAIHENKLDLLPFTWSSQICRHTREPIRSAAIHGNQSDLLPFMGTNQIYCHPWEPLRSAWHPLEPIISPAIHGNQSDLLPSMGTNQIFCHPWEQIRPTAIHENKSGLPPST
jgi:hypothetical protein